MFDATGINLESIKVGITTKIGRLFSYTKKEYDEHNLDITLQKANTIGTQIEQQQIAHQVVIQLPDGLNKNDQTEFVKAFLGTRSEAIEASSIPPESSGGELLVSPPRDSRVEDFLQVRYVEYAQNKNLLLGRSDLLFVYRGREGALFTKEKLVFLTQSSLENDFPVWFWLLSYREGFESVIPLLQTVFLHSSKKIRKGVVHLLNNFKDTFDEVVVLMQNELDPEVLGYAASIFLEKKDVDNAQRIIANALTRKITPIFSKKSKRKLKNAKIDLGAAERRFLHTSIKDGWPNDQQIALMVLSLSAQESDLDFLESILTQGSNFVPVISQVLSCIASIGKTTKADHIYEELLKAQTDESFVAHLNALVSIRHKAVFPKLLEWLGDITELASRLRNIWSSERGIDIEDEVQNAIIKLLDKDTYELLIQYILANYSADTRYGNLMSWRHFWILRDEKNNPEVTSLLKKELRLKRYENWQRVISNLDTKEKELVTDKDRLLSFIKTTESKQAFILLRKLYKHITPEEAISRVAPIIDLFKEDLIKRLKAVGSEDHPEEVKALAQNDVEKFLGENRTFYNLQRTRKKGSRYDLVGEEDLVFKKLDEDIDNFSIIEKEYFKFIFTKKTLDINKLLLSSIGRPYDVIYDSIQRESGNDGLSDALGELIKNDTNPLIRLRAIEALLRLGTADLAELRIVTLTILIEARVNAKARRGMNEGSDDWFVSEILYLNAVNALVEFGIQDDFKYIQEVTNREKIITRSFHRYAYFFDYSVIEELLDLSVNLEDKEERVEALLALDSLDYRWSTKILGVEN